MPKGLRADGAQLVRPQVESAVHPAGRPSACGAQGADRSYPTPNTLQPLGSLPWPRKLPPVPPKTKSLSPHRYPAAMLAFMAALMDPPRKLTFLERYCTSNSQLAMTQLFNLGMLVYVAEGRTAGSKRPPSEDLARSACLGRPTAQAASTNPERHLSSLKARRGLRSSSQAQRGGFPTFDLQAW